MVIKYKKRFFCFGSKGGGGGGLGVDHYSCMVVWFYGFAFSKNTKIHFMLLIDIDPYPRFSGCHLSDLHYVRCPPFEMWIFIFEIYKNRILKNASIVLYVLT